MSHSAIAYRRLIQQRILPPLSESPEAAVRWMGAMQAQDYAQAVWAVGLRSQEATLADVERAIADRKIIRTWPMRGTIHFVPAQDAKWMIGISAARMVAADRRRQEDLGLSETMLQQSKQLFFDALQGDHHLSRPAMLALLDNAGISTAGQRGYHLLYYAAITGLICITSIEDKQQTFALLDEFALRPQILSREEALAELARRYFTSHGPATSQDFARWAGLTMADVRLGLKGAQNDLISEKIEGVEYWLPVHPLPAQAQAETSVYLLPGFDEYMIGYQNRNAVLEEEHADKIVPGGNGVFRPMLVIDGQICGTWKRVIKKSGVEINISPFAPLTVPEETLSSVAIAYAQFLGLSLNALRIEPV